MSTLSNLSLDEQELLKNHKADVQATLFPCPFCGGAAEIRNTWTISYWAECVQCDAQVGDKDGEAREGDLSEHRKSISKAHKAWNNRTKATAALLLCFIMSSCGSKQVVVWTIGDIASAIFWGIVIVVVAIYLAWLGISELIDKWKKRASKKIK